MCKKIAFVGAGSWGTALAISLGDKGHKVSIWDIDTEHVLEMQANGENRRYLPGVLLGENVEVFEDMEKMLRDAEVVVFAAPAQHFRSALKAAEKFMSKDTIIVNVAKGIEQNTLMRMSEIAEEILPDCNYVVLSGPSHAEEVGRKFPTTVVCASKNIELAEEIQDVFITDNLRVYTNTDVIGVELGGALKNIIALGAGISDGMGYGDNAKAALMTRGMSEMSKLGVKLGAKEDTFAGLTGMGDLIVTCTSMHSRNRRCGIMIGEGMKPTDAVEKVGMVVEGIFTAQAAHDLAEKVGVEMPITTAIHAIINDKTDARKAVYALMTRKRKHEKEEGC